MSSIVDIIAILAIPFGIPALAITSGYRTRMAKLRLQADNGASRQADERIAALENRIRVLERIVTDRGTSLAQEIEALRGADAQVVPEETRITAVR